MSKVVLKNIRKVYDARSQGKKEANNLQVTEDGVVAVQDFNIEIADKEFVVLVGPSGCGKSTTLRMIAGLEEITSGELYIDDQLMNDVEPKDRNIAMVFQNYALYPHMTVHDNIAFSLKLHHLPKQTIEEKVNQAAEILDIKELLNRRPKELSGGQRQRVAIGRAIVRNPKVLLMDEPLSNLDAKLRNQMRSEIINLRKDINTTFIYVTHDQTEAMTLGDRIVVMKDGFIQQIGTPQEVFDKPNNLFVAGFIGTPQMNFFDAKLTKKNVKYSIIIDNKEFALDDDKQKILKDKKVAEQDIIVGVRPEHIILDPNGLKGIVKIKEMMGSNVHLHISIDDKDIIQIVSSKDCTNLNVGDDIAIGFDSIDTHLFSKEDEKNILL